MKKYLTFIFSILLGITLFSCKKQISSTSIEIELLPPSYNGNADLKFCMPSEITNKAIFIKKAGGAEITKTDMGAITEPKKFSFDDVTSGTYSFIVRYYKNDQIIANYENTSITVRDGTVNRYKIEPAYIVLTLDNDGHNYQKDTFTEIYNCAQFLDKTSEMYLLPNNVDLYNNLPEFMIPKRTIKNWRLPNNITKDINETIDLKEYTLPITIKANWNSEFIGDYAPYVKRTPGEVVFTDGSACFAEKALTKTQKDAAVAYIIGSNEAGPLGVGLYFKDTKVAWCANDADAREKSITENIAKYTKNAAGIVFADDSDNDGGDNYMNLSKYAGDYTENGKYPVFEFATKYEFTATNLADTDYRSGWYIPALKELSQIFDNYEYIVSLRNALGLQELPKESFWSSNQSSTDAKNGLLFNFNNYDIDDVVKTNAAGYVLVVRNMLPVY